MAAQSRPEKLQRLNWRERPFGAAIGRLLGIAGDAGNATVAQPGNEAGKQSGLQAGNEPGEDAGPDAGFQAGAQHVHDDGLDAGNEPGNEPVNEYGFEVGRLGDTLVDLEPGDCSPPDAADHAAMLLTWLQGTDAAGNWMRRTLLEKVYAGPFLHDVQMPSQAWQTVARHFRKLSGVRVRQKDLRVGEYREDGPTTATDYWIPKRSASVVKLAAAERKRA